MGQAASLPIFGEPPLLDRMRKQARLASLLGKTMLTIRPALVADLPAITSIYNEAVASTTATFDTQPKSESEQREWFAAHGDPRHPVFVAEQDGAVVGWASLNRYSDRCAYADTANISVYIDKLSRGKGVGRMLMEAILARGSQTGLHSVLAHITSGNDASTHLHEALGFRLVGTLREVGKKFDQLLDVHIYQIIFPKEVSNP